MVDLSFAGRQRQNHPTLSAMSDAHIGDPITLVFDQDRWQLQDSQGRSLGRMSKSFVPPSNTRFVSGEVAAILRWRKEDGDEAFHHMLKRDAWEVVIPELVFEADDHGAKPSRNVDMNSGSDTQNHLIAPIEQEGPEPKLNQDISTGETPLKQLRSKFSDAVDASRSWDELQVMLEMDGVELAPRGGGLILRSVSTQKVICKASELGFGYAALIKIFNDGFPGHSHKWIAERALGKAKRH